jgi:hypothetical protein
MRSVPHAGPVRDATVRAGRVEIPFSDKYDLAELAEALERAHGRTAVASRRAS